MPLTTSALFREMHRLRRFLRDLQEQIDESPRLLKAHQQRVAKQETALRDAVDGIKKQKAHIAQMESELKSTNQQVAKYEKQRNEAASKKEYDALQSEISHTQGKRQQQEDAILTAMLEVEERTAKIPDFEAQLKRAKDDLAGYESDMSSRMQRLKDESERARTELAGLEGEIPALLRPQIDRMVKAFGPDAFAAVKERTCQQCYTSITEQHYNELLQGKFVTCKNCARGLYLVE
jgi:uncharacterized protein